MPQPLVNRQWLLAHLRHHARVVLCGAISQYVDGVARPHTLSNAFSIFKEMARMEAFFIYEMADRFPRAEAAMAQWIAASRLRYQEDILEDLERMPQALIRLFEGRNVGKQLVHVAS